MDDLADYRKTSIKKKPVRDFPKGILDVVETDYPSKYFLMFDDQICLASLFSNEEWIDILAKSRNSYTSHIQRLNLTRKYTNQGNRAKIG